MLSHPLIRFFFPYHFDFPQRHRRSQGVTGCTCAPPGGGEKMGGGVLQGKVVSAPLPPRGRAKSQIFEDIFAGRERIGE